MHDALTIQQIEYNNRHFTNVSERYAWHSIYVHIRQE